MRFKKKVLLPLLLILVAVLAFAGPGSRIVYGSELPPDLARELQSIKIESGNTEAAGKALTIERATLEKEKEHLVDSDYLLQRGTATFKAAFDKYEKDNATLVADMAAQKAFAAEVNAEVANHNSRCAGTYADPGYVASCNAELPYLNGRTAKVSEWGARVNAEIKRVGERRSSLLQQQDTLKEGYNILTTGTVDWAKKQKAYNDRADKLEATKQQLRDRMARALVRLAQTDAVSKDCAEIAKKITPDSCKPVGDPSDPANWNTPCERAHRCLQKVWDGAK